jgi:GT2 family glycosyltransferase
MRTAVVILNWNTRHFLETFLPSVIKHSADNADIIVADNDSTDDSIEYVTNHFPSVKIIRNTHNDGYTGGYNSSLAQLGHEYFVLLNSDVDVTENWLQPVISLMDENRNIGASQPKILSYENREMFEYAGAAGGFIDRLGYPFCRGRIFQSLERDNHQYDDICPVFWVTGACMIVRSSVFRELGGFDPVFFAHMEEIDLCWRMLNAGHGVYYCGKSTVYHVGGGTLHKSNPHKTFLNFRNNLLMIYKNMDAESVDKTLRMRRFLDSIAAIKFLLSGGLADFMAVRKAH